MGRDLKEVEAALAHDLNNYLQVIMGNLELLRRKNAFVPQVVDAALSATRNAAQLADRLTALGRLHPYQPRPVDLARLLADLRFEADVAPDLAPALIDPRLLHVVLLELSGHSRDAIADGARLRVRATKGADGRVALTLPVAPPEGLGRDIVEACLQRIGARIETTPGAVTLYLPADR